MVKTKIDKLKKWIGLHKKEFIVLCLVLSVGAFFRFYKIDQYMTFLGDEGRDVLIVRRFLVNGDIFLIGPGTSIGNMYLGPLYYYMMAPALWLGNYSPVAPAVQIAILGVITIWFVWFAGREWFGNKAGLIAAFLYAIAPTVIIYSRSSWNPNIMPFFALLCIFAVWRIVTTKKLYWLPILGVSFAAVLQSHYLGLLLAPTLGIFWLYGFYLFKKDRKLKSYIRYTVYAILLFSLLMSPLVIFDSRHNWQNFGALKKFLTERQTTVSARPWNALPEMWPLTEKITSRLMAGKSEVFGAWLAAALLGGLAFVFKDVKKIDFKRLLAYELVISWLFFAFIGLGLYKQEIYDHYYGFFFPAPFIMFGAISGYLINKARIRGSWLVATFLVFIVYFNLADNPLRYNPNNQLARTRQVAQKIMEEADNDKFNLAVVAERNYEAAYQYFLEKWGTKITEIDPQHSKETITNQLFVVCELPKEKCDPTHDPKAQVANFGWSKVEQEWDISGVVLYKLVHTQ